MGSGAVALYKHSRLTYDRERYGDQDIETTLGFLLALQYALRVKKMGLLFLGVPCGSFAWVSSSKHRRSEHAPFGDTSQSFVVRGNKICARSVLVALLALARGTFFFRREPRSISDLFLSIHQIPSLSSDFGLQFDAKQCCPMVPWSQHQHFPVLHDQRTYSEVIIWNTVASLSFKVPVRWMGVYGHWCYKPSLGISNWCDAQHILAEVQCADMMSIRVDDAESVVHEASHQAYCEEARRNKGTSC